MRRVRVKIYCLCFFGHCLCFGKVIAHDPACLPTESCEVILPLTPLVSPTANIDVKNQLNVSFMQDEHEKKVIHGALKEWENRQALGHTMDNQKEKQDHLEEREPEQPTELKVTGIFYTSPHHWSVWMGDHVYNQDQCDLDDVLGKGSVIKAKNAHVVEIVHEDVQHLVFLGHSYKR